MLNICVVMVFWFDMPISICKENCFLNYFKREIYQPGRGNTRRLLLVIG
jgi:hypothetical protein